MITVEALKAANYCNRPVFESAGWICNGWWMVRAKGRRKLIKEARPELANAVQAKADIKPRIPVKEIKRDIQIDDFGRMISARRYRGGGVSSHVQECMAVLLDGYSVARLGTDWKDPLAGLDSSGEVQVVVMPVRR